MIGPAACSGFSAGNNRQYVAIFPVAEPNKIGFLGLLFFVCVKKNSLEYYFEQKTYKRSVEK